LAVRKTETIHVTSEWTLFLDRDGVINKEEEGSYVTKPEHFEFLPGVLQALKSFDSLFSRIVIVTNQQGVGKGLLSADDLDAIHAKMMKGIKEVDARIDKIYYCPDLATTDPPCRKPRIGMAESAKKDFPEIDFAKSIMIGNYITDMEFARNAGLMSILVEDRQRITDENRHLIDYYFSSLLEASLHIKPLEA